MFLDYSFEKKDVINTLRINHYYFKSEEEWFVGKIGRGDACARNRANRKRDLINAWNSDFRKKCNCVEDEFMKKYIPLIKKNLKVRGIDI